MIAPLRFVVPGPPVGKERARSSNVINAIIKTLEHDWPSGAATFKQLVGWLKANRSRLSRHHTPKKTRAYEKHVRSCAEAAILIERAEGWPTTQQVFCDLEIYHKNAIRPDPDNVVKAIADALTGLLWKDDRNVLGRPVIVRWPASQHSPYRNERGVRIPCVCVKIYETGWEAK